MYNATILLFKKYRFDGKNITLQWKKLRTKYLKNIKESIINKSQLYGCKYNTKINAHVLDGAIQEACKNYRSCLTNLKKSNIKFFRLRYLKKSNPIKTIKIEKILLSKNINTFCSRIFSKKFKFKSKYKFNLKSSINSDFLIQFNRNTNTFFLLNPIKYKNHSPPISARGNVPIINETSRKLRKLR